MLRGGRGLRVITCGDGRIDWNVRDLLNELMGWILYYEEISFLDLGDKGYFYFCFGFGTSK